jgi:hypothetical protein
LIEFLHEQQATGVSHIAFNMKPTRRRSEEVLDELAEHVLPHFGHGDASVDMTT